MTSVACPGCGAPGPPGARFCEACGLDLVTRQEPAVGWEIVIGADREQFEALSPEGMTFPADADERVVVLDAAEVRIGRRNAAGAPEVDLADPAVSHAHALLARQGNGAYALVDLGSANGTTVNGAADPIAAHAPLVLADGDRVHVGAWTTLTVRAVRSPTA